MALNSSLLVTITQAIRVNLLARATIAFALPLRITSALNQRLSASVRSGVYFETDLAPWINKALNSLLPFLVIRPNLGLPPELACRGTKPHKQIIVFHLKIVFPYRPDLKKQQ